MPKVSLRSSDPGLRGRSVVAILALSLVASAYGQDLATLAKLEKERRAKVAKPAPTYGDGKEAGAASPTGNLTVLPGSSTTPSAPAAPGSSLEAQKAEWKSRADQARKAVTIAESQLAAAEIELAEFRSDVLIPSAQELLDPLRLQNRQVRVKELTKNRDMKKELLANAKNAILLLERDARANGVPPGWLR